MKFTIQKASTNVTAYIFIQDSTATDGSGVTGLVYNSTNLTCYYVRPLAASTVLNLADLAAVTTPHADGGFKEIDATNMPGVYRLDFSDAVCATGVNTVMVYLFEKTTTALNMAPVVLEVQLVDYDPNAADMGLNDISTAEVATELATYDAPTKAELDSGLAALNDISTAEVATELATYDAPTKAELDSGLAALNDISTAEVATELATYDAPTKAELDSGLAALNDISTAEVATELATYDAPTKAELDSGLAGLNDISTAQVATELATYDAPTKAELDSGLAGLNDPTVTEIVNGVCDEALASHSTADSLAVHVKDSALSPVQKNTSFNLHFMMKDSSNNPVTGIVNGSFTKQYSLDTAGTFSAIAGTVEEIGNGMYYVPIAAGEANGDFVTYRFAASGAKDTVLSLPTSPEAG